MFETIVIPAAYIVAALAAVGAFVKGGLLGLVFVLAAIAAIRFLYSFIRWHG